MAAAVTLAAALMVFCGAVLAVPPGTEIPNTALATYDFGRLLRIESRSNTVVIVTFGERTPSSLEFMHYAPGCSQSELLPVPVTHYSSTGTEAGPFVPIPPPSLVGDAGRLDSRWLVPLIPTTYFHHDEPVFLRIIDLDQNRDRDLCETVLVSLTVSGIGESELLQLTESGPDTGEFLGYIGIRSRETSRPNDGTLSIDYRLDIEAVYTDLSDETDKSTATSWPDATGIIFDTSTGQPLSGIAITLVDADTGLPSTVYGLDGHSLYPSTVISGETVTDESGREYDSPPGAFGFPFPDGGPHRFEVAAPEGYKYPSAVPTEMIQALPGAPFAIVEPVSRGGSFFLECRLSSRIDIPVDPAGTELFLTKAADREWITVGDFVEYSLRVENTSNGPFGSVSLEDRLPRGFAYQTGSTTIDGAGAPDPEIAPDGGTLKFPIGSLASNSTSRVRYVAEAAAGVTPGSAVNTAIAVDTSGIESNTASASVRVIEDPLVARSLIVGSVVVCDSSACSESADAAASGRGTGAGAASGIEGVRILLEDGTYTLTDRRGMFHFQALRPGAHVVQLDLGSLPPGFTVIPCERNSRFAGRSYSRFVDLEAGTMWRTDFHVALKPAAAGEAGLEQVKPADRVSVKIQGAGGREELLVEEEKAPPAMPDYGERWLAAAGPGLELLWPEEGFNPAIPSIKVAVKHMPGDSLELSLNGEPVDPLNFDRTLKRKTGQVAISRWSGIDLEEGDNRFLLVVRSGGGRTRTIERTVHYSGPPVEAELVPGLSRLSADGIEPPVIAVRLKDRYGHPARTGVVGAYTVDPPHVSLEESETYQDFPLSGMDRRKPQYMVGRDGVALIRLEPTAMSGEATVRFDFIEG
ncbi:MAG: hypothetical protein PVH52_04540, partial [bacterium]